MNVVCMSHSSPGLLVSLVSCLLYSVAIGCGVTWSSLPRRDCPPFHSVSVTYCFLIVTYLRSLTLILNLCHVTLMNFVYFFVFFWYLHHCYRRKVSPNYCTKLGGSSILPSDTILHVSPFYWTKNMITHSLYHPPQYLVDTFIV